MKVLVTGCHGFLGHHVAALMRNRNHDVFLTDRETDSDQKRERQERLGKHATYICALDDFGATLEMVRRYKPEVIVHLAGQFPMRHGPKSNVAYVQSNVTAWLNVAEAAKQTGVRRMIYASSITAHDRPSSIYGATKLFADHAAHAYSRLGLSTIGLRYAAIYGPAIRRESPIYRVARQVMEHKPLSRTRGFMDRMLLCEITDAAAVTVAFAESDLAGRHVHLVAADDERATLGDIACELGAHLGVDPIYPDGYEARERAGRPDLAALRAAIGFVPEVGLARGMKSFAEWVRKA